MTELKPCPWCGGEAHIESSDRYPRPECEHVIGYTVVCRNFGCIGYGADDWYKLTEQKAIEAWNTRYEPTCEMVRIASNSSECQECGCAFPWHEAIDWYFCPNCGAKVIEE